MLGLYCLPKRLNEIPHVCILDWNVLLGLCETAEKMIVAHLKRTGHMFLDASSAGDLTGQSNSLTYRLNAPVLYTTVERR